MSSKKSSLYLVYILIAVAFGGFSVRDLSALTGLNILDLVHLGPTSHILGPGSAQPRDMSSCPSYTVAGPQPCLWPCFLDGPQPHAVIVHLLNGPLRHTL